MLKRIAQFIIGAGCCYGANKFAVLTFTLLASGQFFTTLLAACFALVGYFIGVVFVMESVNWI